MEEKRKFARIRMEGEVRTQVVCAGTKEDVRIMDVSAGGMKAAFKNHVDLGADLFGKLRIPPAADEFYIKGTVARIEEKNGEWETVVRFDKVSTMPFLRMHMYQTA